MQESNTPGTEPVVLTIRISGRWVPVLSALSVFALLPALTASTPLQAGAPQNLAAPRQLQEAKALGSSAAETVTVSAAQLTATALLGGGTIGFPNIALNPIALNATSSAPLAAGSPFVKKAGFIMPVSGPIMSLFGPRVHPVLGVAMFHTGIDLGAACATPIRAAADGTVTYAGVSSSWGQRIIVEHDAALKTGYAHLSKSFVKEGDAVKQGQVIGLVGTTGWSTGCHLHFDVILNDRYVDPRPYLGLGPASPASIPYTSSPHRVSDGRGSVYAVPDGDVPIPTTSGSPTTTTTTSTPTTTTPSSTSSGTPTTSTTTTTQPSTGTPTTSEPTTSTPTTSEPTSDPTTTTEPAPSTTTSDPAPEPAPSTTTTTSDPAPEPAPSTTTTTSDPAPAPAPEPAPSTTTTTPTSTASSTSVAEPTATTAEQTSPSTTTSSP